MNSWNWAVLRPSVRMVFYCFVQRSSVFNDIASVFYVSILYCRLKNNLHIVPLKVFFFFYLNNTRDKFIPEVFLKKYLQEKHLKRVCYSSRAALYSASLINLMFVLLFLYYCKLFGTAMEGVKLLQHVTVFVNGILITSKVTECKKYTKHHKTKKPLLVQ